MDREEMREKLVALRARQDEAELHPEGWQDAPALHGIDTGGGLRGGGEITYTFKVKCHIDTSQWIPVSWLVTE